MLIHAFSKHIYAYLNHMSNSIFVHISCCIFVLIFLDINAYFRLHISANCFHVFYHIFCICFKLVWNL